MEMSRIERLRLFWLENFLEFLDGAAPRRKQMPPHLVIGRRGERAALFYLRRLGFVITACGWKTPKARGDLDLIAWENGVLCFVEVKTRTTRAIAPAEAAVDADKKQMLRKMAHYYLRQVPNRDVAVRFDILSIYFEAGKTADFQLFRGAFGWD
ncbi:MAG TPA: YraN family protein [Acidobacteriaceae bacterium]|nr:YraN family protein [Acidobacteriaceae bacterium]